MTADHSQSIYQQEDAMTPATKSFGIVGLRLENNQGPWLRIAGLGVCSLLSMLLMSDDSWAAPKKR